MRHYYHKLWTKYPTFTLFLIKLKDKIMTHDEKLLWMLKYCKRNNVTLELLKETRLLVFKKLG